MVKCIWSLLLLFLCCQVAWPQHISLSEARRTRLVRLVASNEEVGVLFSELKQQADAALAAEPQPVTSLQSQVKPDSDSLSKPNLRSLQDMRKLEALAYAYAVTANAAYSTKAKQFILGWATVYEPAGNPLDEAELEPLIVAYDLTRRQFSTDEQAVVERWLRNIVALEWRSRPNKAKATVTRWNGHRLKNIGLIGFLLSDAALIDEVVYQFKQYLRSSFYPDGSSVDLHQQGNRTDQYTILEPLLTLALVAQQNGINLYDYEAPNGASLSKAVDFSVVNSEVSGGRTALLLHGAAHPQGARRVFELASGVDQTLMPWVHSLHRASGNRSRQYPSWRTVLNAIQYRTGGDTSTVVAVAPPAIVSNHDNSRTTGAENSAANPSTPDAPAVFSPAAPPAASAVQPLYEGSHELTNCDSVSGWAWDKNQPNATIKVDIYDGATLLTTVTADTFRQDLMDAGKGSGKHGFTFVLPYSLQDGQAHSIQVKVAGTDNTLAGTPRSIICDNILGTLDGFYEQANCETFGGWVWSSIKPDAPIAVDIYDGDLLLATITADLFRPDLVDAGKGNGKHGFLFSVPAHLKDGRSHSIQVKVSGTNIVLPGSPKSVTCGALPSAVPPATSAPPPVAPPAAASDVKPL